MGAKGDRHKNSIHNRDSIKVASTIDNWLKLEVEVEAVNFFECAVFDGGDRALVWEYYNWISVQGRIWYN